MKNLFWPLAVAVLVSGCATSTIESRKQERITVYSGLTYEQKAIVNSGQIKIGMPMDAVYIAWGSPSQIIAGENAQGSTLTWLYFGTFFEEHRFWSHRGYFHGDRYYSSPYLAYDYQPRGYVRAEVKFEANVVKEWRSLPQPGLR